MVLVDESQLHELFEAVFQTDTPEVFVTYSEYGCELVQLHDVGSLEAWMDGKRLEGTTVFGFAIWYPSCGGRVEREKVRLKPEFCQGHTFRYVVGGWGIFHLQFAFRPNSLVEAHISVNSEKRALKWASTYSEWLAVELWNWPLVRKHERRLTRKLRLLKADAT